MTNSLGMLCGVVSDLDAVDGRVDQAAVDEHRLGLALEAHAAPRR